MNWDWLCKIGIHKRKPYEVEGWEIFKNWKVEKSTCKSSCCKGTIEVMNTEAYFECTRCGQRIKWLNTFGYCDSIPMKIVIRNGKFNKERII